MEVSEIRESIKELEKSKDVEYTLEVLKKLNKNFEPTEPLLRETKLGVAVNKLRSHSDPRVADLVKRMIGRWKETIQAQKQAQARAKASKAAPEKPDQPTSTEPGVKPSSGPRTSKSDGVNTAVHDDKVRNSCVDLIYNAIAIDSIDPSSRLLKISKDIEACVFAAEKGTSTTYRTKMRSLYMNLKDPKNPTLRARVISGAITSERLRTMTPQEMASAELKKEIEAIEKQNLFNAQGATEKRAVTDRFTCGKCKEKKVSYYQMQTRSADEPLTTFCTCEACGNRWKFS